MDNLLIRLWSVVVPRVAGHGWRRAALLVVTAVAAACNAQPKGEPETTEARSEAAVWEPEVIPAERVAALIKESRGKVVVANFWATWCVPCVEEMPELAKFFSEYKDRVTFLSVSVDDRSLLADGTMAAFLDEHRLPFPVHLLQDGDPELVGKALNVEFNTVPATFVYDKSGELVKLWEEGITYADLHQQVEQVLQ